ncbi:hypothetical protein [Candidatus Hydrogenosomobacter endosymbioticus]|uniref:Uncharacterized protein n=1 Tax=Candidatus Hydrogenosomobacter endosymbioticus TaxID=2558174 RepID=A0ABM7V9J8_9PROT|nr:hypothetical protein [Candidatus Hydrogenosomobacter endosymbioticus]BDB96137.1 hypothetical protein HYD_2700 [Candidatus Hydrogenosomobacter endosymbioticus]
MKMTNNKITYAIVAALLTAFLHYHSSIAKKGGNENGDKPKYSDAAKEMYKEILEKETEELKNPKNNKKVIPPSSPW